MQRIFHCAFDLAGKKDFEFITPQFRENYANSRNRASELKRRLAAMKSFTYVTSEKPSSYQRERLGAPVSRLCACKMVTTDETCFYTFELTADNPGGVVPILRGLRSEIRNVHHSGEADQQPCAAAAAAAALTPFSQ